MNRTHEIWIFSTFFSFIIVIISVPVSWFTYSLDVQRIIPSGLCWPFELSDIICTLNSLRPRSYLSVSPTGLMNSQCRIFLHQLFIKYSLRGISYNYPSAFVFFKYALREWINSDIKLLYRSDTNINVLPQILIWHLADDEHPLVTVDICEPFCFDKFPFEFSGPFSHKPQLFMFSPLSVDLLSSKDIIVLWRTLLVLEVTQTTISQHTFIYTHSHSRTEVACNRSLTI